MCVCLQHFADAAKGNAAEKREVARATKLALQEAARIAHLKRREELSLQRKSTATENGAEFAAAATPKKKSAGEEKSQRQDTVYPIASTSVQRMLQDD